VNRPHRDPCRILSERPATFYQVPFGYYRIVPIKDSLVVRIVVAEPAVTTEGLHAVDVQVVRNIRLPDQRQTYTAAWAATKTSTRPHSRSQRASSAALTACLRCAFASTMRLTMPNKSKVLRRAGLSHRAREVAGGTESLQTPRWREMDSNYWSRHGETPLGRTMWFPRKAPPAWRGTDPESGLGTPIELSGGDARSRHSQRIRRRHATAALSAVQAHRGTERCYGAGGGGNGNFVAASNDGVPRCPSRTI